jgi:hypothetical protein
MISEQQQRTGLGKKLKYVLFSCTLFRVRRVVNLQYGHVPIPPPYHSISSMLPLILKLFPDFVSNNMVTLGTYMGFEVFPKLWD